MFNLGEGQLFYYFNSVPYTALRLLWSASYRQISGMHRLVITR